MSIQSENIKKLVERREKARLGGGPKRIEAQHAKGKKTARETSAWTRVILTGTES